MCARHGHIRIDNFKQQIDQIDEQTATDFSLSEDIDDTLLEILEKHEELKKVYKGKLGFRIFRCT